jgi:recombination protein RecT
MSETEVKETSLQRFNRTVTSDAAKGYIKKVMGKKADSFVTNIVSIVSSNANLQVCEPFSILFVGMTATSAGLSLNPSLGEAFIVPYNNSKTGITVATFQPGYKGIMQLAVRSGQYRKIVCSDVREGELISENVFTGEYEFKQIEDRENKPIIGYMAYFKLVNGYDKTVYWTKEKVEKHAKHYSQTYKSSKSWVREKSHWTLDFDGMAKKTVLKNLLNGGDAPKSIEMQNVLQYDQASFDTKGNAIYVDNEQIDISSELAKAAERAAGIEDGNVEEVKENKPNDKLFKDGK